MILWVILNIETCRESLNGALSSKWCNLHELRILKDSQPQNIWHVQTVMFTRFLQKFFARMILNRLCQIPKRTLLIVTLGFPLSLILVTVQVYIMMKSHDLKLKLSWYWTEFYSICWWSMVHYVPRQISHWIPRQIERRLKLNCPWWVSSHSRRIFCQENLIWRK